MGLQAQAAEKFAECLGSHTAFEAEHQQRGHNQADQPGAACLCFPQRRLWVAVSAIPMAWRWRGTLLLESPVRSARLRILCLPCSRIALKMTTLLAHNPMASVRALKGG